MAAILRLSEGTCICGRPTIGSTLLRTYLGEIHKFCGGGCTREFDQHSWLYTVYLRRRAESGMRDLLRGQVELQRSA